MQPSQNDYTVLPSAVCTASASSKWSFRGSIATAYTLAVYASQRWLPSSTQDSLPAGGSYLCRAGFVAALADPLGPIRKVSVTMSRCIYIMLPPSQGLPGANRHGPSLHGYGCGHVATVELPFPLAEDLQRGDEPGQLARL